MQGEEGKLPQKFGFLFVSLCSCTSGHFWRGTSAVCMLISIIQQQKKKKGATLLYNTFVV